MSTQKTKLSLLSLYNMQPPIKCLQGQVRLARHTSVQLSSTVGVSAYHKGIIIKTSAKFMQELHKCAFTDNTYVVIVYTQKRGYVTSKLYWDSINGAFNKQDDNGKYTVTLECVIGKKSIDLCTGKTHIIELNARQRKEQMKADILQEAKTNLTRVCDLLDQYLTIND